MFNKFINIFRIFGYTGTNKYVLMGVCSDLFILNLIYEGALYYKNKEKIIMPPYHFPDPHNFTPSEIRAENNNYEARCTGRC